MQALSALVELFRYFVSWAPYPLKVLSTQRAVKFRTVSWFRVNHAPWWTTFQWWSSTVPDPEVLEPGFYWYTPAITEVVEFSAVDDFYAIPARYAVAADGVTVSVRSILTCRITGFLYAATHCESIAEAIVSNGIRAQAEVVSECASDDGRNFNGKLIDRTQVGLRKYGVTVVAAALEIGVTQIRHHVGLGESFPIVEI